jgi:hypothetical protein
MEILSVVGQRQASGIVDAALNAATSMARQKLSGKKGSGGSGGSGGGSRQVSLILLLD